MPIHMAQHLADQDRKCNWILKKILKRPKSKLNIEIRGGDEINIAMRPNIIQVMGEVNAPGLYKYHPNKRVSDIIEMAGGFSQDVEKSNIFISYPNGLSKKYSRWLNNRKVYDGSVIVVGKQKEKEPFNRTEFAKDVTGIIANLAQAITVFVFSNQIAIKKFASVPNKSKIITRNRYNDA